MRVRFDADDVDDLVNDLRRVAPTVERRNEKTLEKSTRAVLNGWRRDAAKKARKHGKLYPRSITAENKGVLETEIGPQIGYDQAGMGRMFEWGGPSVIKSPAPGSPPGWWRGPGGQWLPGGFVGQHVGQNEPHLSMTITMDKQEPLFERAVADDALPWW